MAASRAIAISKALAAAALFGASAPLAKVLVAEIEPMTLAAFLYLGSGIGAAAIIAVRRLRVRSGAMAGEAPLVVRDLPWLLGAVVAGGVAAPIVLLFGLRITPAATASLLLSFEIVATTLVAALVFREPTGPRVWAAVALVTLGSALLSLRVDGARGLPMGAMGVLAACLLWGIDNNFTRKISGKDPIAIVAIKGLGAGLCSLSLAIGLGAAVPTARVAVEAMALGFASFGLSIVLFIGALRDLGAARTGALFGTAPFLGALLSFILFLESPDLRFVASVPLILGGSLLLLREAHSHGHDHGELVHEHRHSHDDGHHDHDHEAAEIPAAGGRHSHLHRHAPVTHAHEHTPDLHHEHGHS